MGTRVMVIEKRTHEYPKDAEIISEGSKATNRFFYLVKGTAVAEVKGEAVGTIRRGEWFGEMAAILGTQRTASVRAVTVCEVMIFKGLNDKALIEAMSKDPKLVQKLIQCLAGRLVETSKRTARGAEESTGTTERYRKAISGTACALEKIVAGYKSKIMKEVLEHLVGTSGIPNGDLSDVNLDFFPSSRSVIQKADATSVRTRASQVRGKRV